MAEIGPNTRLRASPFYQATLAEGVTAFRHTIVCLCRFPTAIPRKNMTA